MMSARRFLSTFGALAPGANLGTAGRRRLGRRQPSLRAFGACVAAALLLVPATASAQADTTPATARPTANQVVTNLRTLPYEDRYDRLQVWWESSAATLPDAQGPFTGFRVMYKAVAADANLRVVMPGTDGDLLAYDFQNCGVGLATVSGGRGVASMCDLTGLKAGQRYGVRVAPYNAFGVGQTGSVVVAAGVVTAAPAPDRVTGTGPANYLCTTAGACVEPMPGDKLLRVKWAAPAAGATGLTIASYTARWRTSQTSAKGAGSWSTLTGIKGASVILANLTNGQMYDIEVAATNSAGSTGPYSITVRGTPMMPTPALPLFGALALGAAVAAGARRRLRRRQASLRG